MLVTIEMVHVNEQEHMRAAMMRRNASIVRRERRRQALGSRFGQWLARFRGSRVDATATSGSAALRQADGCADAR